MIVRQLSDALEPHDVDIEDIEKGRALQRGLLMRMADRLDVLPDMLVSPRAAAWQLSFLSQASQSLSSLTNIRAPGPLIIRGRVLRRLNALWRFGLCRGGQSPPFRDFIPNANAGEKHFHGEGDDRTNGAQDG